MQVGSARLRHLDGVLRGLREGGFPSGLLDVGFHTLQNHIVGHALQHVSFPFDAADLPMIADATDEFVTARPSDLEDRDDTTEDPPMTIPTAPAAAAAHDPACDLLLERLIDVPVELVWQAWTDPDHLRVWFVPAPWEVAECEIDPRPGGIFRTVMRDPEGTEYPDPGGCILEAQAPNRLVWTSVLGPGFRPRPASEPPADGGDLQFTAELTFEPVGESTRYTARAIHASPEVAAAHEEMGFSVGWGAALDQLVAHVSGLAGR
jgi:uncharacterized protein YndB with AHSA1/START domain